MADTEGTSSSIPTSTNSSRHRASRGRGGRFRQAPRQVGANTADNLDAAPLMNPRGGHRGGSGNKRGRGQKEGN